MLYLRLFTEVSAHFLLRVATGPVTGTANSVFIRTSIELLKQTKRNGGSHCDL